MEQVAEGQEYPVIERPNALRSPQVRVARAAERIAAALERIADAFEYEPPAPDTSLAEDGWAGTD